MSEEKVQYGTVLIFKEGADMNDVKLRLQKLGDVLEYIPRVNEFNPDWGGPVWYIP